MYNHLVTDTTKILLEKYPIVGNYESKSSLWSLALKDGMVSKELFDSAKKYYGNLWYYTGD